VPVPPPPKPVPPPVTVSPPPAPEDAPPPPPTPDGAPAFTERDAERLLWRAGFGPAPGQAAQLAAMGLRDAVLSLTRPSGDAQLTGAAPVVDGGDPIDPVNRIHHEQLFWLDRMVRTDQPLVERLAYVLHDWFATSNSVVNHQGNMLRHVDKLRGMGLGSFHELVLAMTADPAMLTWLDGTNNYKGHINENYARELMELFTLGADRGAYTEQDVREMARALTGFRAYKIASTPVTQFGFQIGYHDTGVKTIFGQSGAFNFIDVCRMCIEHPLHASFFVEKLWGYFVGAPLSSARRDELVQLYLDGGRHVRPVLESILMGPEIYEDEPMVKPPVVFLAGMLRRVRPRIDTFRWAPLSAEAGQRLMYPPDVGGWDFSRWLSTQTIRGRWQLVEECLTPLALPTNGAYDVGESAEQAVDRALEFWQQPSITEETRESLVEFARTAVPSTATGQTRASLCAMRQNALRHLVGVTPDFQVM
jgi:hypothetical protein